MLVRTAPDGDEWVHELKFDGYRILARRDRSALTLLTRRGNDWTAQLPAIRDAVARLPARRLLLDGEAAVLLPDGRTSFQALQNALGGARGQLAYFVFDLLHVDGEDLTGEPLEARKRRLADLLGSAGPGPLRYSDHVVGHGPAVLEQACARGIEGIICKRRDRPYQPGRRGDWLKVKCLARQELVIGGFTDPEGQRSGIGALLVGYHDDQGRLVFAGKVGTGFSHKTLAMLHARLKPLGQPISPFAVSPPKGWLGRHAHWVRPELVAEVAFSEWTADGRLRHPSFQGLRDDKPPRDVHRERPAPPPPPERRSSRGRGAALVAPPQPPRAPAANGGTRRPSPARVRRGPGAKRRGPLPRKQRRSDPAGRGGRSVPVDLAGQRLTHPERVLWPDCGVTKLDLARYYATIADHVLPHLRARALTLVRCPEGLAGECFYMKHSRVWSPPGLRKVRIREKTKTGEYLVTDDLTGLVGLVQMDVLELHTWNSTVGDVERPDRIVLDLDPGPEVRFPEVVETARLLRAALAGVGLEAFVKTTGGKGLHVVVPLVPEEDWGVCFRFSRAIAEALVREHPRRFTTAMPKAGRERKILIDYFRNNRTNTSVAAYSSRARPGAPVSVPLAWDELGPRLRPDRFTVQSVPRRLASLRRDPWARYWTLRQRLRDVAASA
jgi:bifunctional non-homologous end joining protein LigD